MSLIPPPTGNFFIKQGYMANDPRPGTKLLDGYWTETRIRLASRYQYHVYCLAASLARKHGLRSGLDLGCGTGAKSATLLQPWLANITLMDVECCRSLVARLCPRGRFIAVDLETCRAPAQQAFDLIVCADVVEHLRDPSACLAFARDHLAREGMAVFSTPERDMLRGQECNRSPHEDHVREWNRHEFRKLLEWAGFRVGKQVLCPPTLLPPVEEWSRLVLPPALRPRRWQHCQVAVCTRR